VNRCVGHEGACTPKIRFLRFLGLKLDPNSKIDAKNAMKARSKPSNQENQGFYLVLPTFHFGLKIDLASPTDY